VNRKELCNAIAAHTRMEAKNVETVLKGFSDVVIAAVCKGEAVLVSGFAKFDRVQTNARNGRNPATGQAMRIPAAKKAHITPLKGFQDVVNGNAPAPKLNKGIGNSTSSSGTSRTGTSSSGSGGTFSSRSGGTASSRTGTSSSSKSGTSKASSRPMVKTMTMKNAVNNKKKAQNKSKALAKR
jgi:DNA-binding protein HU-beta